MRCRATSLGMCAAVAPPEAPWGRHWSRKSWSPSLANSMSTGVRSLSLSTWRRARIRARKGVSESSPSNVTTRGSVAASKRAPGRLKRSPEATETIRRSHGRPSPYCRRKADSSTVSKEPLSTFITSIFLGAVALRLVGSLVQPQTGLTGRHQHRIVVRKPVHRPSSEAGNDPQKAVLATDARRPAELVVAEADACEGGKKVWPYPLPHHLLDQDAHLLVEVQKAPARPVLDGVGIEHRSVDLGDGVGESVEPTRVWCRCWEGRGSCTCPRTPRRGGPRAGSSS